MLAIVGELDTFDQLIIRHTKLRLVLDLNKKSRGYAFIEFERERDMKAAYRGADGMRIDNRRILVDVERGRTHKGWLPRRLGGGLGSTRASPVSTTKHVKQPQKEHSEAWGGPSDASHSGSRGPRSGKYRGWRGQVGDNSSPSSRYSSGHPRSGYGGSNSYRGGRYPDRSPTDEFNYRGPGQRPGNRGRAYPSGSPVRSDKHGYGYPHQRKRSPHQSISRGQEKYQRVESYNSSGRSER